MNRPVELVIFITGLVLGVSVVLSSPRWADAWLGVEISTLSTLPLIIRQHGRRAVKATMKYSATQALSSMAFLFAVISNMYLGGCWNIEHPLQPVPAGILIMGLALKLGVVPFHFWLPKTVQGLDLSTGFLISTWQKVVPLLLLVKLQMSLPWPILMMMGLLTVLVGGWGGAIRGNVFKSVTYCSIAHTGWMVVALQITPALGLIVFIVYCMTTTCVLLVYMGKRTSNVGWSAVLWVNLPAIAGLMPLTLFSLECVYPFSGLLPQCTVLMQLNQAGGHIASGGIALMSVYSFILFLWMLHLNTPSVPGGSSFSVTSWRSFYILIPGVVALAAAVCLLLLSTGPLYATFPKLPFQVR